MNEPLARTRGGVHAAVRHDSAVGHVTGAARYLDDVPTALQAPIPGGAALSTGNRRQDAPTAVAASE